MNILLKAVFRVPSRAELDLMHLAIRKWEGMKKGRELEGMSRRGWDGRAGLVIRVD